MKHFTILAAAAAVALFGLVALASAGTASGTTRIVGPTGGTADGQAHADTPTDVELTISTGAPVVPYEYSLINKCWFDGKTSGPSDSFEQFLLAGPWFEPEPGGPPTMVVSVNVQPVPEGARCKVSLAKNNTAVKGSTTAYDVEP